MPAAKKPVKKAVKRVVKKPVAMKEGQESKTKKSKSRVNEAGNYTKPENEKEASV